MTTFLFVLDLVLRLVMGTGTLWVAWRLLAIKREVPTDERLLRSSGDLPKENEVLRGLVATLEKAKLRLQDQLLTVRDQSDLEAAGEGWRINRGAWGQSAVSR